MQVIHSNNSYKLKGADIASFLIYADVINFINCRENCP